MMTTHHTADQVVSRKLLLAIGLTIITLLAEIVGGVWTNSLALLSDAAHVFMDVFALSLSLLAIRFSARPATERRTFGLHRLEILASLINGATLLFIAGGILYAAAGRLLHPEAVKSREMFVIAVIGLVMNLVAAWLLHGHHGDDLNVRSAYLHVLGDAAASVGVIIGGMIMLATGWYVVDALVSMAIALTIAFGALRLLREAGHILLEGVPSHIDLSRLVTSMQAVDGVVSVHHLHLWSVCSHITVLAAHVDLDVAGRERSREIIVALEELLERDYHIRYTTLQLECSRCEDGPVLQELGHRTSVPVVCSHGHAGHQH
jgi:cobalt-zinc-cadmium efflux system protein